MTRENEGASPVAPTQVLSSPDSKKSYFTRGKQVKCPPDKFLLSPYLRGKKATAATACDCEMVVSLSLHDLQNIEMSPDCSRLETFFWFLVRCIAPSSSLHVQSAGRTQTLTQLLNLTHGQGRRSIWDRGTSRQYLDWGTLSRMSPSIFLE